MACCSKRATSFIPAFLPSKPLQLSTPLSRPPPICRARRVELSFSSSYSSTTISRGAEDGGEHRVAHMYNWIDGAEALEKYKPGGYHPIMIGDMLHGRYRIVDKLGFGGYSTVWLAQDTHPKHHYDYVAVKVGIANSLPHETEILRALAAPLPLSSSLYPGRDSIPCILDEFKLQGPNGTHLCYTMPPARCNLREVSFSRLFPLEVTRALSGGLTLAVAYMHSRGYAHGDIHLRNILVKLPSSFNQLSIEQLYDEYGKPETVPIAQQNGKPLPPIVPAKAVIPLYLGKNAEEFSLPDAQVLLSDFGEAFAPALEARRREDCHTPLAMRPPEARFEPQAPLSFSADIWSLAIAIWEILGMKAIFSSEFATADDITSQQIDVLGPMPLSWWERWDERSQFFYQDGRPKGCRDVWYPIDEAFEEGVQQYRRKRGVGEFGQEETAALLELMCQMLAFRPEERPTAEEVLKSEWMVKWVLPDFKRSLQMGQALQGGEEKA
ncbi:CMGC/SRPK protein kinase [Blastomyces parvus]|uniref:non-specific serine/threonine protein kinase n=1 Tax=Blastomyces parvus TaxID=2060905 RepID=A0A2B7X8A6_9EURO|nr:CMGC/SRPK protein kinase [Blastomyces parvus]